MTLLILVLIILDFILITLSGFGVSKALENASFKDKTTFCGASLVIIGNVMFISLIITLYTIIGQPEKERTMETKNRIGKPISIEVNKEGDTTFHYNNVKVKDIEL